MKMRLLTVLFFLVTNANAQTIHRIYEPLFYKGKSLKELQKDKLVLDEVTSNHKVIFLKIKTLDGPQEFYRMDDSTYVFRKKGEAESGIFEKGEYRVNLEKKYPVDTIVTFHPETYEEAMNIITYCHLTKDGWWIEKDELGNFVEGEYFNGERHGGWNIYWKDQPANSLQYNLGVITRIYSPNRPQFLAYESWFIEKAFLWSYSLIHTLEDSSVVEEWSLRPNADEARMGIGVLLFKKNGTFSFKRNKKNVRADGRKEGIGNWTFTEDAELVLTFIDGKREKCKISSLGNDLVRLKNKKTK